MKNEITKFEMVNDEMIEKYMFEEPQLLKPELESEKEVPKPPAGQIIHFGTLPS